MNCPRCGMPVTMQMNRCSQCGQPVHVYLKIIRISNSLYNIGLERARVRDLSGAVDALNKSLKCNKNNINARNLLGLVYYEMGETVMALTEWILSKNICPEDNEANNYIDSIQSNPARLDSVNQTIKKYNAALVAAKQGSDDMAIIQLKKVVSLNPHFIRAQQLLALLYMNVDDRASALKCLNAIKSIDINNTTTIRYLKELGVDQTVPVKEHTARKVFTGDANVEVKPVGTYKDEKPRAFPFINVMIGVIIGLFVGIVLIAPTISNNKSEDQSAEVTEYGEKLAAKESEISSLKYQNENLTSQVDELEKQLKEASEDDSLSTAETYDVLLDAYKKYVEGDKAGALAAVNGLDMSGLDSSIATEIVGVIQSEDAKVASTQIFEKGRSAYNSGKYDEAKEYLKNALKLDPDNSDAVYFMGRLYHKQGNKEKAVEYYKTVVNKFPDSSRCAEAKNRLKELGVSMDSE